MTRSNLQFLFILVCGLPLAQFASRCLRCDHFEITCIPIITDGSSISHTNLMCEPSNISSTSQCSMQNCSSGSFCRADILGPVNFNVTNPSSDWTYTSNCLEIKDSHHECAIAENCTYSTVSETCAPVMGITECLSRSECCCVGDNCLLDVSSVNLMVPTTTTITTTTTSTRNDTTEMPINMTTSLPPGSGSLTPGVTIGLAVAGSLVGVLLLLILLFFLCHCGKKLSKCYSRNRPLRPSTLENVYTPHYSQPWVLKGLVGQGRFGHVYKALYDGNIVAVKVYSHHNRNTWENERNLFSLESTWHENIVHFITCESSDSRGVISASPLQLYLVTEYYPLGSLEGYLRGNRLSWKQACTIVRDVACGLKHLHSEFYLNENGIRTEKYSIAHRDIKSSNLLMKSEEGNCVIGDLGLALQLIPTNDPKDVSNYGQCGTIRYMSPEALEARVNLLDIQSFKQIDIYAFSLVMWEVLSRCCVLDPEDVEPYQLPYENFVVHPSIDLMKDIVCTRQLRPPIPSLWSNNEPLSSYVEMMKDCWDRDPDARLTAANISYRIDTLYNSSPQVRNHVMRSSHLGPNQVPLQNHAPLDRSQSHMTGVGAMLIQEHSQSSPPPYYSPTDPIPFSAIQNQENRSGMRRERNLFQTSMPHIMQSDRDQMDVSAEIINLTPRCTRSLRASVTQYTPGPGAGRWGDANRPPLSVRNSLVLGEQAGRSVFPDDPLPTFCDSGNEEGLRNGSHSTPEMEQDEFDKSKQKQAVPSSDSGIQITLSESLHSVQSPSPSLTAGRPNNRDSPPPPLSPLEEGSNTLETTV